MAPRPALEKQYMSSTADAKPSKPPMEPRPSASILLLSPTNEILLLHRVRTSSSFASAHVFPGGNISASQDGEVGSDKHVDGPAYRLGAIRECFEESGILLAHKEGSEALLEVEESVREKARKDIHSGKIKFADWVKEMGGVVDIKNLKPFTRWITPTNIPKRFTTQMYLYFLPLFSSTSLSGEAIIPIPTSDGGIEHTAASFAPCVTWLQRARSNEIILFPPQFYLLHLLSRFLSTSDSLQQQRANIVKFLEEDRSGGNEIKWADKVMSPIGLFFSKRDGRSVLGLGKPGPELKGSGRGGDEKRVVLVRFTKEGPRDVEVRERSVVLQEERENVGKL